MLYVLEGEKEMKKVIGIVFIVFTLLTLSSCKEKEKTRFDELYDENFDTALEVSKISQSDRPYLSSQDTAGSGQASVPSSRSTCP